MSWTVMDRASLVHRGQAWLIGSRYDCGMRARLALVALVALAGCARQAPERPGDLREGGTAATTDGAVDGAVAADDAGDADAGDAGARALAGYPTILELREGQERLGFVAVPLGAREPRPLMVALHGGSETPNKSTVCPAWREITDGHAFVVCPRGFGGNERALGWRTRDDTEQRIQRAVDATKRVFTTWVKDTPSIVLAGFSMGATQVALLAGASPARYRRIAVGDSAHDPGSSLRFSTKWGKGSGERALFLCTTSGCEPSLRAASKNVAARGGHARLNVAPTQVHGLSPAVVQSMRRDWPWLVEGAEGWESYVPPADGASLPGRTETFDP